MEVYYRKKGGEWERGKGLWEALSLDSRRKPGEQEHPGAPFVICLAGAGGKTSCLRRLAWEGRERNMTPVVITTTHIYRPSAFAALNLGPGETARMAGEQGLAVAGCPGKDGKLSFPGWDWYEDLCGQTGLILVEADGSRRLPIKTSGPCEPVIPANTSLILCVLGLSALGRPLEQVCFRLERALKILGKRPQEPVGERDMERLMAEGYLRPLREAYPRAAVVPVFHQADGMEPGGNRPAGIEALHADAMWETGMRMLDHMGEQEGIVSGGLLGDPSRTLF